MRRSILNPLLKYTVQTFAADLFTDIQHLNWNLPSVKAQESSFVGKVQRLLSPNGGSLRAQVWDPENLGKMPPGLQSFYSTTVRYHIEEALIETISKIMKMNRNGLQSLANDIEKLASLDIEELGGLPRVQKYIELLRHVD